MIRGGGGGEIAGKFNSGGGGAKKFIKKKAGAFGSNKNKREQIKADALVAAAKSQGMSKNMKTGLIIGGSVLLVGIIVTVIVVMHKKK